MPTLLPSVLRKHHAARTLTFLACAAILPPVLLSQSAGPSATIRMIDASVANRDSNLLAYTVTEQYRVFRNTDRTHPAAEMTVKTTYRKDNGKTYVILAQSGSELLLKEVLGRILDSERLMTQPANRSQAVLTSSNYNMTVTGSENLEASHCTVLSIVPRRNSPYLFRGRIWVDDQDGSIVKLEGVASKSASILTGATQVSRRYEKIDGLPMATHATALAGSWLLGQTEIDIDYTGYNMTLSPTAQAPQAAPQTPPPAAR